MDQPTSRDGTTQQLSQYRWLSFDVVGTLIDFEAGIVACLREIASEAGVRLDEERALSCFAAAEDEQQRLAPELPFTQMLTPIYRRIATELGLPNSQGRSVALRQSIPSWPAFPDAVEVLAKLRHRYRLVALTNADNWALEHMAATLGSPFHDSVTAEDVGVNKPDPRVFEYCADRQQAGGYRREAWLHVAQSQFHDIATARRLGVATCWIERRADKGGFGATPTPQEMTVPDYHYATLTDLWAAIEGV
ncbi:HAD-IA family hydrolase [Ornithinimicrobium pratense]|uniref:HAD-IA family hydrolase n=1 Tax=Ornithinimicrobium pratense TaxID=2593973 RepID=A0A5J6V1M7_9MICO|nr:HAD-IA family hydrolase [Ornithinimicrobium pratense]QFG67699.1 HAD-IA family hydrolase [Ornithinimicrobium pratense]